MARQVSLSKIVLVISSGANIESFSWGYYTIPYFFDLDPAEKRLRTQYWYNKGKGGGSPPIDP